MNVRKLGIAIVGGVATLSLIGVGAGASFTDTASGVQEASTGSFQLTMYPDGNAAAAAHSITFAPADNISSAGLTKVQSATVLNSGTLSGNFVSITVSHTGTLPIGVSAGPAFGGGKNLVDGTYIVSYIPGGLVLPPGVTVDLPLTYTVAPDSPQGESGTVTVTANGVS